jgi:hypothetical protein
VWLYGDALLGVLVIFAGSSTLAPFIYSLF